jgi:hypothetical protein
MHGVCLYEIRHISSSAMATRLHQSELTGKGAHRIPRQVHLCQMNLESLLQDGLGVRSLLHTLQAMMVALDNRHLVELADVVVVHRQCKKPLSHNEV